MADFSNYAAQREDGLAARPYTFEELEGAPVVMTRPATSANSRYNNARLKALGKRTGSGRRKLRVNAARSCLAGVKQFEINRYPCQRQGMAQWNQIARFFRSHDAGHTGDAQHITFFRRPRFNQGQGGRQHLNTPTGDANAVGSDLGGHIHHVGLTLVVKMGKLAHVGIVTK